MQNELELDEVYKLRERMILENQRWETTIDESYSNLKIVIIGFFTFIILAGFIGRIFFIEKAFDKGAIFACTDASTSNNVQLISKRKGAHLIGDMTSTIQKNKMYNLFFCDVVKDDNFKEIKKEIRKELTE